MGKAVTGFGMAIIFLFVWNIAEVSGYDGDFKYAVFIQSLALICIQPISLYNAQIFKHAYRHILVLFIPITLVSTPLGQLLSEYVPTKTVQAVAGAVVALVALWELYTKKDFFLALCEKRGNGSGSDTGGAKDDAEEENSNDLEDPANAEDSGPDSIDLTKRTADNHEEGCTPASAVDSSPDAMSSSKKAVSSVKAGGNEEKESTAADADKSGPDAMSSRKKVASFSLKATGGDEDRINGESQKLDLDEFEDNITVSPLSKTNGSTVDVSNSTNMNDELKIGLNKATFITLLAGGASGFLGGLVAIRGPPLIFYFLHPPKPVTFNKNTQRATATVITFFNVFMRQAFYLYNTFSGSDEIGYQKEDWALYLSVIICSTAGVLVGNKVFDYLKDSKNTIRAILAVFLLLSGVGLLFSAFR